MQGLSLNEWVLVLLALVGASEAGVIGVGAGAGAGEMGWIMEGRRLY